MQVHAYVMMPGGKTAYLSELRSGSEVLIINSDGKQRTAVVGRTKIEQRPLVSNFNFLLIFVIHESTDISSDFATDGC